MQHVRSMTEMMAKSKEMSAALGCSSVFVSSIVELLRSTNDAMILRFLLKMLHVINKYHSSPRQFVLDNDLYNLVKEFTQSSAKVLVSELANRLLQEFENSTKSF